MNANTQSVPSSNCNPAHASSSCRHFTPAVDVVENDNELLMSVEMPGVRPDQVEVSTERNLLKVTGTAEFAVPEGYRPTSGAWGSRSYERTFRISDDLDRDRIDAEVKDGVLTLRIPKSQRALRQSITVRGA